MSYTLMKNPTKVYYYPLPWETGKVKGQKDELKTYLCQMAVLGQIGEETNVFNGAKTIYYSPWENQWILVFTADSVYNRYNFPRLTHYVSTTYTANVNICNNCFDGYAGFRSYRSNATSPIEIHRSPDGDNSFWVYPGYPGFSFFGSSTQNTLKTSNVLPTIDLQQNATGAFKNVSGWFKWSYTQANNQYRRSIANGRDLDVMFETEEYKDADGNIDNLCGCWINPANTKIYVGNDFFKINVSLDEPENFLWFTSGGSAGQTLNFYNEDGSVEAAQYYSHRGMDYNYNFRIDYFYRYASTLYPNLVTGWYLTDFSRFYETLENEKGVYKFNVTPTASNSNQTNTYTLTWVKLTEDAPDKPDISISYYGSSRRNCYNYIINGSKDYSMNVLYSSQEVLT